MSSGPGVGAAVAVAGGTDVEGAALPAWDGPALDDGLALGEPNRHPLRSSAARAGAIGAGGRMRAA